MTFHWRTLIAGLALAGLSAGHAPAQTPPAAPPASPSIAPARPVSDTYFGTTLMDPYRWMEKLDDPEVKTWFRGQADYSRASLDRIPGRAALLSQIKALDSVSTLVGEVQVAGNRYFYQKARPNDNTLKLYVREGLHGPERLLFDPEKRNQGKTHYALDYYAPSLDGTLVAYGVSAGGSEQSILHILSLTSGKELPETIDRTRFGGVSWRLDGRSFFYDRQQPLTPTFNPMEDEQKIKTFLHVCGTDPSKDIPILGSGISTHVPMAVDDDAYVAVLPDAPYAVAVVVHGVLPEKTIYVAPTASVTNANAPWQKVADVPDGIVGIDSHGDNLYLLSHKKALRFQLLRTRLSHPTLAKAAIVVPESRAVVVGTGSAQDALYVDLLDGGIGRILRVPYDGGPAQEVPLPYKGAVGSLVTDYRHPGALFREGGWTHSALWYRYDPKTQRVADTGLKPLSPVSMAAYTSSEVLAKSADGTLVPLSIITKRGLKLDGSHPRPAGRLRGVWHHEQPLLQPDAHSLAGPGWRHRRSACAWRGRVRRRLAPGRPEADQTSHLGRFHRLRPVFD